MTFWSRLMNNERIKTGIDHSFADHSIYVCMAINMAVLRLKDNAMYKGCHRKLSVIPDGHGKVFGMQSVLRPSEGNRSIRRNKKSFTSWCRSFGSHASFGVYLEHCEFSDACGIRLYYGQKLGMILQKHLINSFVNNDCNHKVFLSVTAPRRSESYSSFKSHGNTFCYIRVGAKSKASTGGRIFI